MKKSALLCLALVFILFGCSSAETQRQIFLMDTIINISVQGEDSELTADKIEDELMQVEKACSPTVPDSLISVLNSAGDSGMEITPELYEILNASAEISRETSGAFDISLGNLIELWNIGGEAPQVPTKAAVAEAIELCGMDNLELSENYAAVRGGVKLNLGGVAKGYAADRTMQILEKSSASSALVYIGGNICVYGAKPDGSPWNIGIRDPNGTASDYIGILQLGDTVVSASGDYERYFEDGGVRYHHIIDPSTGYPSDSGISSVTVVCRDGMRADALSTALFVMGKEKAIEFWRSSQDFECVIIDKNKGITVTEGLKDKCRITDGGYSFEVAYR